MQEKMEDYLKYKLAPYPVSIFDDSGLRKTKKSSFYDNFKTIASLPTEDIAYVIDGGFLLHRVLWHVNETILNVWEKYVLYVKKHFHGDVVIVFDGYKTSYENTKSFERLRRQTKYIGREINFELNTKIIFSQDKFLSNPSNKSKLINMVCENFYTANILKLPIMMQMS